MRNEGIKTAEFHWRHKLILPTAREVAGASQAAVGSGPSEWAFLVVTVGLLGYGVYLARDAWGRLLAALVNPGSPDFIIISLAIQVVAPMRFGIADRRHRGVCACSQVTKCSWSQTDTTHASRCL